MAALGRNVMRSVSAVGSGVTAVGKQAGGASIQMATNGFHVIGDASVNVASQGFSTAKREMETIWKDVGGWKFVVSTALVIVYMFAGAGIFMALELGPEKEQYELFEAEKQGFNETVSEFKLGLTPGQPVPDDIEERIQALLDSAANFYVAEDAAPDPGNWIWDFGGSFFFAMTLITTIGYGSFSPMTTGGKTFAVCYALVGIPVFCNYLLRFAMFTSMTINLVVRLALFMNKTATAVTGIDVAGKELSDKRNSAVISGVFTLIVTLSVILGTAAYAERMEGWNFGDSVYFSFITFTTVGLGDFAPLGAEAQLNDADGVLTLMGYVFFIFFGLSAMGAFVSSLQDFLHFSNDLAQSQVNGVIGEITPILEMPQFGSRRQSQEPQYIIREHPGQNPPGSAVGV